MINNIEDGSATRLREIRRSLNMTQIEFAEIINSSNGHLSDMEKGRKNITDSTLDLLSLKLNVNIDFLKTGEGKMFIELPEEDETAAYVSDLLEDVDNPFYMLIKEIMHTYNETSPKSQEVLRDFSARLRTNLESKKKEG